MPIDEQRFKLRPSQRLRRRRDFQRVFDARCSAGDALLVVYAVRAEEVGDPTRLGTSVSRRVGGAVKRNRIKRLIRTAFRLAQHDLPRGWDLVVVAKGRDEWSLDAVARSLRRLVPRAVGRAARRRALDAGPSSQ